jgi:SpoVK/Ycf46/Vps4 family AAA+-type ATPase
VAHQVDDQGAAGLYEYDAVSRLRDSQLGDEHVGDIAHYIKRGVLWEAFESRAGRRADRRDRQGRHRVPERPPARARPDGVLRLRDAADDSRDARPLVVITSNNEKELPDAFLRRCFFHYIRFPDRETMTRIVDVHFPGLKKALLAEALECSSTCAKVPGLKKKPSTSELLDWLKLLLAEDIPPRRCTAPTRRC